MLKMTPLQQEAWKLYYDGVIAIERIAQVAQARLLQRLIGPWGR